MVGGLFGFSSLVCAVPVALRLSMPSAKLAPVMPSDMRPRMM